MTVKDVLLDKTKDIIKGLRVQEEMLEMLENKIETTKRYILEYKLELDEINDAITKLYPKEPMEELFNPD